MGAALVDVTVGGLSCSILVCDIGLDLIAIEVIVGQGGVHLGKR